MLWTCTKSACLVVAARTYICVVVVQQQRAVKTIADSCGLVRRPRGKVALLVQIGHDVFPPPLRPGFSKVSKIGKFYGKFANFCKFLAGSFSAVSKGNFARKYAFGSIFQALQDLHPFAPLQSQNFSKKSAVWKISNFGKNSAKILQVLQF